MKHWSTSLMARGAHCKMAWALTGLSLVSLFTPLVELVGDGGRDGGREGGRDEESGFALKGDGEGVVDELDGARAHCSAADRGKLT